MAVLALESALSALPSQSSSALAASQTSVPPGLMVLLLSSQSPETVA